MIRLWRCNFAKHAMPEIHCLVTSATVHYVIASTACNYMHQMYTGTAYFHYVACSLI